MSLSSTLKGMISSLVLLTGLLGGFNPASAQDNTDPTSTITTPIQNGMVGNTVNISGTASDNIGVTRVLISIKNTSDGTNWNGGGYQVGEYRVLAANTTSWSYSFVPTTPGLYRIATFAVDASGNRQMTYNGKFFTVTGNDSIRPSAQVSSPTANAVLSAPVQITGTATDNTSVTRVLLSIKNLTTGLNWNGSGFVSGERRVLATGTSNWSYNFAATAPGLYRVAPFAVDSSGNVQNTYNPVKFTVQSADTLKPDSQVSAPSGGSTSSASAAMIGTATDNVQVSRVMLSIKNLDLGENWNGSSFQAGEVRVQANGTSNWSYNFTPGVPGRYRLASFAIDSSNNIQGTYNGVIFNIAGADSALPTSSISNPVSDAFVGLTVSMSGTATDDVQVDRVLLSIKNLNTGQNWNGSTMQNGEARVLATGTSSWNYSFTAPVAGKYRVASFAVDTSGKTQNTYNGVIFSMGQEVRIMALGDSITEGIRGEQSYRKPLRDELELSGCYYDLVGSRTRNQTLTGFVSDHEGYSEHKVDFFTEGTGGNPGIDTIMSAQNPDVVLVHLGSNDMYREQPITGPYNPDGSGGTISELDVLVTKIWNANPNAKILLANVIPWYGTSQFNANVIDDINALTIAIENWVANKNDPDLRLVDVRSGYTQAMMSMDLIHPNSVGDAHIADAFLTVMDNVGVCQ